MGCYIASNDNRFYVALETDFGAVASVTAGNRVPAVRFTATDEVQQPERRDKTGSRTYRGTAGQVRRKAAYGLQTYLVSREAANQAPSYGPLFEAAMGGGVLVFNGATVDSVPGGSQLRTTTPHGLTTGQGIAFGGEVRFVASVVDAHTVELNVPFSVAPTNGSPLGATISYALGKLPKSVSVFDYWSPDTAVHRIVSGATVDEMRVRVNGDFHEFEFRGPASSLIDSSSFSAGQGQLTAFPVEPALADFSYSPVPGYLGQAWIGAIPERFATVTEAELAVVNNIELRGREFGAATAKCFAPGRREVRLGMSLYEQDSATTKALYQSARDRAPVQVMFQLGQQAGQMFGFYMKSWQPEVPRFDDRETRVQWRFTNGLAQGVDNDELFVCFG